MYTLLISLASALLVAVTFKLTFVHSYWGVVPPALMAFLGVAILLLRRASTQIEPVMKAVEKHMLGGRRELALKALRDAMPMGLWNPLLPGQLRVQTGALEYVAGNLENAEEELSRASRWPWMSRAYLGCVYFKRRNEAGMKKAFETAVSVGDKEGVAWSMYAWCLVAQGKKAEAVSVLERGLKKLPGDHRLEANLELAKEGKKLKMAPYGDAWTRFALEGGQPMPTVGPQGKEIPKYARGYNPRPGFRQKPKGKR